MKKLMLSILLISSTLVLAGCGFGGCGDPCGGTSSYVFSSQANNCCSALPW